MSMMIVLLTSCNSTQAQNADAKHFGEKITADNAIDVLELKEQLEYKEKVETKVTGVVESVCQVKGCWMNLTTGKDDGASFFVKFKDYGFFVPLDFTGKKVVIEGYAFKETTSVDELRHYAEDEGKSKEEIEAITEPVEELKFMASGVVVVEE